VDALRRRGSSARITYGLIKSWPGSQIGQTMPAGTVGLQLGAHSASSPMRQTRCCPLRIFVIRIYRQNLCNEQSKIQSCPKELDLDSYYYRNFRSLDVTFACLPAIPVWLGAPKDGGRQSNIQTEAKIWWKCPEFLFHTACCRA
jgi:hypothetical protein